MDILDIGGGFSMNADSRDSNFDNVAFRMHNYLTNMWPSRQKDIKIIGEPGRQICEEAQTLVVQVFLVKK